MLDQSPWGLFWKMVGEGAFSLLSFRSVIDSIPSDVSLIQEFVKELSGQPANDDIYVYLILQAASFGGKAIWIKDNKWQNTSFRSYWLPTATSNRRSPVNPMMPMPETLYLRVAEICDKMLGVKGLYQDIREYLPDNGTIYIDPPYRGTTGYGFNFDLMEYCKKLKISCYVSEGYAITEQSYLISGSRGKGGISGERVNKNKEWLCLL